MRKTRTGSFPIGFREVGSMKAGTGDAADWAKRNGFTVMDTTGGDAEKIGAVTGAGLSVGSINLPDWKGLAIYATISLLVAWGGFWVFQKTRKWFADVI